MPLLTSTSEKTGNQMSRHGSTNPLESKPEDSQDKIRPKELLLDQLRTLDQLSKEKQSDTIQSRDMERASLFKS